MAKERNSYDIAVIKQIVADGNNVVPRVVNVLVPGALVTEETTQHAKAVLGRMFDEGMISCPTCKASNLEEAALKCVAPGGDCPISGEQ